MMEKIIKEILLEKLSMGVLLIDTNYTISYFNNWLQKHTGYTENDVINRSIFDVFPEIKKRGKDSYVLRCVQNSHSMLLSPLIHQYFLDLSIVRNDENIQMIQEVKLLPISKNNQLSFVMIIIKDLTEQTLYEKELVETKNTLNIIRKINQIMVTVPSEALLFKEAIKVMNEDTNTFFVWYASIKEETSQLSIAHYGGLETENFIHCMNHTPDFLENLQLTQMAIETGECQISFRKKDHIKLDKWWQLFNYYECLSVMAIPIKSNDQLFGILHIHRKEKYAIKAEIIYLYKELARDISFCIEKLLHQKMREVAEKKLKDEYERLRVTLRGIGDGVIATDSEGKVVLLNTIAENLTGWTEQEAIGRNIDETFHIINEFTRKPCFNPVEKVLKTGKIIGLANHTALVSRDGIERIIADSGAPIRNDKGKIIGVVLVFRDITQQSKLEKEMMKIQKLESIGLLAGGIAHDFNNILGIITGNVQYALTLDIKNPEFQDILTDVETAAHRARDLTHQLLTFASGGVPIKKMISIGKLIKESAKLVSRGANVQVNYTEKETLKPAAVDHGQISQVVQNLVINGIQSMPEGGNIVIETSNVQIGKESIMPIKPGLYIKVDVIDQGCGIASKHLDRIFDPFFTTKQKGSGLGLATVYSIIKKHGGHIKAASEIEKGTTFTFFLPAIENGQIEQAQKTKESFKGNGKILVMDDDEALFRMLNRMFNNMGYEVHFARHGYEAIDLYKTEMKKGVPYDLVILDLTVPGSMGGKDTIKYLKELHPDVKAVVSSGYSNDPVMANYTHHGFCGVLPKPVEINNVIHVLKSILE
jgi:PAS domain S-box-containing protein